MDTKTVAPQPIGGDKEKNEAAQRRNRRVLGDIGNLESDKIVQGKPDARISRPVTRRFHAQLLANAQAEETKNEKPVVTVDENKIAFQRKRVSTRKAVEEEKKPIVKPQIPDDVVVISSDGGEKVKQQPKGREGSSTKKEVRTLTSILTARSKAASEVPAKPKEHLVDIDAADVQDELAVVEYIDDLYKYYKLTEEEVRIHDYMSLQTDINTKMRSILIDWLIDVHRKFELMPETLYLTVNIIDRYLSARIVSRRELQLIGISSMVIASKYEEVWAPQVNDFVCLSDYAYSSNQILITEKAILEKLEWYLTVPTPYVFLVRYIKASVSPDQEMENMVFFLAELGIMHYATAVCDCPSRIAAASVYAARCTLNKKPFWSETLKHHTGYSEEQLRGCAKLLVEFHSAAADGKLKAAYRKFSKPEFFAVACFTPAKSLQA